MKPERKDLVSFRPRFAPFPRLGVMLTEKKKGSVLLETGVKGKGVVERVPLDRIFHDFGKV